MVKVKFEGFGNDKEVEVASCEILLRAAKDNGIAIPCDCQDGECGSCTVEVVLENPSKRTTERLDSEGKELKTLVSKAIITKQEAEQIEMFDRVPKVRLACQMIVRDNMTIKPYL